ncbi:MAG: gluconate 2-dehydrogenase subunit 3 family protein [Saprospiraceae bacterium]|jgi:gluconate 2-dehydrogenase gamma chain
MKRRNVLKGIGLSSLGLVGLHSQVKAAEILHHEAFTGDDKKKDPAPEQFGRTEYEKARDAKLFAEQFFSKHELHTIGVLADIILPRDERSGSATDSGVPDFIEFMAKDQPSFQTPLRGGIAWLDNQSNKRFGKLFVELAHDQQIAIVEDIAYPGRKVPGMSQGVAFFSLMRNLTASGFWSSKMGIEDIGYQGNIPNMWDGPPKEVLEKYGLL